MDQLTSFALPFIRGLTVCYTEYRKLNIKNSTYNIIYAWTNNILNATKIKVFFNNHSIVSDQWTKKEYYRLSDLSPILVPRFW